MTNELGIFVNNNQVVVSSRDVARVFGKEHKNVLRDIKNLECSESFNRLNFEPVTYEDVKGEERPEYLITRDGFTLLAMGFTGVKAMIFKEKYIATFNAMEHELTMRSIQQAAQLPDFNNPVAAARAWADEVEKKQLALAENKKLQELNDKQGQVIRELKPKADYTDTILRNRGLVTITQIAKDYGMSGNAMNTKLHELGVQYKLGDQWLLYAKHQSHGYTHSDTFDFEHRDGRKDIRMYTKWTQEGRLFLYSLLKDSGVLPLIERS